MKVEEKKILDIQFKELGNKIENIDGKMDKFIDESKEDRKSFEKCMTKIKIDVATNGVKIADDRETIEDHGVALSNHLKSHESERNKTIATGGGVGGFLSFIIAIIMSMFNR